LSVAGTGPFLLTTAAGEIHTNCVIVAAGRWSRFRPDLAIPDGSKWIGVKAHFREDGARKSTDLYFFDHGYCGVQPVADGVVNACAMVRSDRARSLAEALQLHPALAERSRAWQPLTEPVSTAPLIYREPEPVRENQAFVGDAAAFIDPFVGDGISIALRTGRVAGKLLSKGCESPRGLDTAITSYRREYEEQFAPLVHSASRIRRALSVPSVLLRAGSLLLRVPGVIPYMIRKTRQVS